MKPRGELLRLLRPALQNVQSRRICARLAVAEARAAEIERQAVAAVQEASNARAEAAAAREAAAATAGRLAGIEEQNTALSDK